MQNDESIHERRFQAAVKVMRTLPAHGSFVPSADMLRTFYAFHKQATAGAYNTARPCSTTRACSRDAPSKAEWEAWKALGDMSKEEAMKAYVESIQLILEMIPVTEEVSDLLDVLEPFYEVVEEEEEEGEEEEEEGEEEEEEEEEEEKDSDTSRNRVTSREGSRESPDGFLRLLGDDGGDVSEPNQPSEVYGDAVRAKEGSGGLRADAAQARVPQGRGGNTKDVGVRRDGKPQAAVPPPLGTAAHGPVQSVILSAGTGRGCQLAGATTAPISNAVTSVSGGSVGEGAVNTQVVVALSRLQDDMQSVLASLSTLEARALSQAERIALHSEPHAALANTRPPMCPPAISQLWVAFVLVWPFAAQLLIKLYLKMKRKMKL